jgi:HK97 family phage major capsid protein
MSDLNALRQQRAKALSDAQAIDEKANRAGRDISASERGSFEGHMAKYTTLSDQIQRGEMLERETLRLAGCTNVQVDLNSEPEETRTIFFDTASGMEHRSFRKGEPIVSQARDKALDFARVIIERCTGAKLLSPERRSIQVDADVQGGYLVSASAGYGVFELARAQMGVGRAGATVLPVTGTDEITLAIVEGDPSFSWARELQEYDLDEATAFGSMKLQARKVITQVECSYEFMRASNAPAILLDLLSNAMAAEIDRVALTGNPAVSGGACPVGVANTSGVLSTACTGGTLTFDQLLDVLGSLQAANTNPNAMLLPPAVNSLLAKIKDGDGRYFDALPSDLATLTKIVSSKMTAETLIMGSFQDLVLVPFGKMEVNTTRDVAGRRGAFLIEIHSFFDCGVVWPGHFATLTGITS